MKKVKQPIFEELLTELEETVKRLEAGNVSLDESIELYKNAMSLSVECNKILENAKLKIEVIENGNYEDNAIEDFNTEK